MLNGWKLEFEIPFNIWILQISFSLKTTQCQIEAKKCCGNWNWILKKFVHVTLTGLFSLKMKPRKVRSENVTSWYIMYVNSLCLFEFKDEWSAEWPPWPWRVGGAMLRLQSRVSALSGRAINRLCHEVNVEYYNIYWYMWCLTGVSGVTVGGRHSLKYVIVSSLQCQYISRWAAIMTTSVVIQNT